MAETMRRKKAIGFEIGTPIRMEEDAGDDYRLSGGGQEISPGIVQLEPDQPFTLLQQLLDERKSLIAEEMNEAKKEARKRALSIRKVDNTRLLLEENRKILTILTGRSVYGFGTENVIYAILIFSAVVIGALSLLNIYAELSTEVTVTFTGTVVGGTIATIAQKLGKVGR